MALGALTLSVTSGVQGRPFQATINGLTTGQVEVLGDGSPGFSTVNGKVMSHGLPYPVSTVVLREYEPGVGAGFRDSRIDIVAATRDSLMAQAIATLGAGRKLQRYRVAGTRQADGSIVYSLIVEDDLGATVGLTPGGNTPTPTPTARVAGASGGQSLAEYPYLRGTPNVETTFATALRSYANLPTSRAFARYGTNTIIHDGTSQTAEDWTTRLDNYASGGSAVLSVNSTAADKANGNYWWNTEDNTGVTGGTSAAAGGFPGSLDVANSPGPLLRNAVSGITARRVAGYAPNFFDWSQGTAEGGLNNNDTLTATYKQVLRDEVFGRIRTAAGSAIPIFIYRNGRHQTAGDDAQERVRRVQTELANELSGCAIAGEEYPYRMAITGNSTGDTTTGSNVITNVASTTPFGVKQGIEAAGFPIGAYVSAIGTGTLTISIRVNGVETACNATVTATGATIYNLDNVHLYPGSTAQPLDSNGNTTHNVNDGFYKLREAGVKYIAQRLALPGIAATPVAAGPYISAVAAQRGQDTVTVTVTHVGGTDLTTFDNTAWRVKLDGTVTSIVSVTKVNATTIALKLSTTISAAQVDVQYAWGTMNAVNRASFIFDNAGYPMQARQPVSAATSAPSASLTATSQTLPAANATSGSSFTFTGAAIGAANTARDLVVAVTLFASAARTISSVVVDGVAATLIPGTTFNADASGTNRAAVALYRVAVDATHGGTGDVVVTTSAGSNSCAIEIESFTGIGSITPIATFTSAAGASPAPVDVAYQDGSIILVNVAYSSAATSGNRKQAIYKRTMSGAGTLSVTPTWAADDFSVAGFTEVADRLVSTSGTPSTAGVIAVFSR